ncbi:MAG: protein kinase [Gemmatimonadetes bacterium]|nr:protein kinase [Gemmatimonadota bacterium]
MTDAVARLSKALAGHYTIERELGAGGMATVYLAHDSRHDRKVALKVLRPELAAVIGADRFLKEIKVTANLQHSHILGLIDSGEVDGLLYYVMPFVEGESLRDRLTREKQLPVEDAVRIAREVANALDYAHRHHVIHRDIKPENILLHDGQALVADFGIALAVSAAGGTRMTETGMSLGTPHYMSPEQAMGEKEITPRSDVYALGAVLYEMLVGEPPFTGPTAQAIVAKVVTETPRPLLPQRHTIPPHVEATVLTALEKLPADRFGSAAEFAHALATPGYSLPSAPIPPPVAALALPARALRWAWPALTALSAAIAVWSWLRPVPKPVTRVTIALPPSEALRPAATRRFALSPDGARMAYIGPDTVGTRLWVRELRELNARPLPGTEAAHSPFFSPDGRFVAFFTRNPGSLKVVAVEGGPARTVVADSAGPWGGDWTPDGTVYFYRANGVVGRIPAAGGAVQQVSTLDSASGEREHDWVQVLPNRKGALVTVWRGVLASADIAVLDFASGRTRVLTRGVQAHYAAPGYLVYVTADGKLWVAPFDQGRLALSGPAIPILEGVRIDQTSGTAQFALSATGTLLYQTTGSGEREQLVWVDRGGRVTPIDSSWWGQFNSLALSPDGRRLAVSIAAEGGEQIWVKQLATGPLTRLTFEGETNGRPAWTPDGTRLAFVSSRRGKQQLWVKRADGSAQEELLVTDTRQIDEGLPLRDGSVIYRVGSGGYGVRDILAIRPGIDSAPHPLIVTPVDEYSAAPSPDGRWLAYTSEESGRREVYVRPFPETNRAKWQVSVGGGSEPVWAHSSRELFYRGGREELMVAAVPPGPTFATATPRQLLPGSEEFDSDGYHAYYAVTPDDRRFVMVRRDLREAEAGLVLVLNWLAELKSRLPR